MIEIILTALLSVGIAFALREWKQSRILCTAIVLLTATGIYFVWEQSASTRVAHALGVGRGADLVLYIYAAISFVLIISLVLRIKGLQETLTDLARAFALAHPARPARDGDQEDAR
ncbi:DUF2304 domain-containing protein [Luteimonas sp. MC1572]|jgi:hypothetical protein|uniref:DUF2304 domain-containing protein n=1 Tax=Luteimonas sp. MC1572 TaxID=2799325 RepID=UPI0018F0C3ED|nr:DUF2304 domain-containing protein [Luteimonas sp. MC1572]MBJ6981368.1 DUF2304 domain-containing protein [Luteimonas sp. MC1572]QQO02681.1 DUF2304 domain-containing protein [Luteimonas sp. MC1572]